MHKIIVLILFILLNSIEMIAQDQGITSNTHEKFVNQIVFATSKSDLAFKKERSSSFKNQFSSDQNIYGRVYLDQSIKNKTKEYAPGVLMYDLYIDNQRIEHKKSFGMYRHLQDKSFYTEQMDADESWSQWTSWKVWLLPEENDEELKYGNCNIPSRAFALALLDLKPGSHSIRMDLYHVDMTGTNKSAILASGQFTFNLKQKDKNRLAFAYAPPLPGDKYKGSDKEETIADIKSAFIQELGKTPLICGIYKNGWTEGTYSLTGQKYRKIAGWAVFEDSDGDGQVPITTFNFISDYASGSWSKLRFDSHCLGCANWEVEVAAVKALGTN